MVDELDDGLAHLNNLDVTWGFDLDPFLQELAQQAPAAGEAGDGAAEIINSSQGGAIDASSVSRRRAETAETMGPSQGGAVDASSAPKEVFVWIVPAATVTSWVAYIFAGVIIMFSVCA